MSRKRDKPEEHAEPAAPDAADPEIEIDAAEAAAADPESDADPAARLAGEVAALKEQLLRALAETENLRRRSAREREDAVKFAAVPLIKDLIGVADNLRRAVASVPAEAVAGNEQLKTLLDGVEMTEKELQSVFARHGIERIEPMGDRLDPHVHEAMFEVPDPNVPAGTVVQVLQVGYRLRERLIRPAQVGVAKGGPGAAAGSPNGEAGAPGKGRPEPGRRFDTSA